MIYWTINHDIADAIPHLFFYIKKTNCIRPLLFSELIKFSSEFKIHQDPLITKIFYELSHFSYFKIIVRFHSFFN